MTLPENHIPDEFFNCGCKEWRITSLDELLHPATTAFDEEFPNFETLHDCPRLKVWQHPRSNKRTFLKL